MLDRFELETLPARQSVTRSMPLEAPADHGNHYYGVCVDAVSTEKDAKNNCSPGIRATVGPTVSISDASAVEGTPVSFRVALSEGGANDIELRWAVTGERAVGAVDYRPMEERVLVIPAGETEAAVTVETIDDSVAEGDDTFSVHLLSVGPQPAAGVVLSVDGHQATGTIQDNDGEPAVADSRLEEAVRFELNLAAEDPIGVEDLEALTQLRAWGRGIESLEGLEAAVNLKTALVESNAIADLSPLAHLARLETLDIDYNPVSHLSPLIDLPALTELRLDFTGVRDLSQLASLSGLRRLSLNGNGISDLTPLAALDQLIELHLFGNTIDDLSALRELSHLSILRLGYNAISDISPLAGLKAMRYLYLPNNRIADLAPLADPGGTVLSGPDPQRGP